MGEWLYFAALSSVDLSTACERLRSDFGLPAFVAEVESEGEDWWEYASADGPTVGFHLTRLGHFANPAAWCWMWGAPDRANYQVVIHLSVGVDPSVTEQAVTKALECTIVRYPPNTASAMNRRHIGVSPGA